MLRRLRIRDKSTGFLGSLVHVTLLGGGFPSRVPLVGCLMMMHRRTNLVNKHSSQKKIPFSLECDLLSFLFRRVSSIALTIMGDSKLQFSLWVALLFKSSGRLQNLIWYCKSIGTLPVLLSALLFTSRGNSRLKNLAPILEKVLRLTSPSSGNTRDYCFMLP